MEESDRHKAIQILFGYIDDYEGGSKFEGEEFINYFENVLAHLKLVRDQNSLDIIKGVVRISDISPRISWLHFSQY